MVWQWITNYFITRLFTSWVHDKVNILNCWMKICSYYGPWKIMSLLTDLIIIQHMTKCRDNNMFLPYACSSHELSLCEVDLSLETSIELRWCHFLGGNNEGVKYKSDTWCETTWHKSIGGRWCWQIWHQLNHSRREVHVSTPQTPIQDRSKMIPQNLEWNSRVVGINKDYEPQHQHSINRVYNKIDDLQYLLNNFL